MSLSSEISRVHESVPESLARSFDLTQLSEYSQGLVSALPEATVLVIGADERVWVAEGRLLARHGYETEALRGRHLSEVLPVQVAEMLRSRYQGTLGGATQDFEYRTADGQSLCWINLRPLYFGACEAAAVLAVVQDITASRRLTSDLNSERGRRRMAEQMAGIGHWEVDIDARTIVLSEGSLSMMGLGPAVEYPVDRILMQIDPADRQHVREAVGKANVSGLGECEAVVHSADGTRRSVVMRGMRTTDSEGRAVVTGTTIDLTQMRAAELARGESEALLQQGFDRSPIGMAVTDAHQGRYLRVNDALCRLLGRTRDELLELTFTDVGHPEDVRSEEVGRREMAAAAAGSFECETRYVDTEGKVIWTSVNVVPVYGEDGDVRAFFSQIVDLTAVKEREALLIQEAADLECLAEIRAALANDRLILHAQPIVELSSGRVVQQELLVRLQRPDGRVMPPVEFLPVAERHGCILDIDRWVTERAMEIAATGQPVEVNLSAGSVGDVRILATIRDALARTGANPSLVVFEVTETALMADIERGRTFAAAVRALGCRFALDDFGTGYGTFTYLKHIPIDYVKIDIEFVRDLISSEADERLVRAMVTMASALGKQTIAEGVENAETLERLREIGVDHAQGYHIGRPQLIALAPAASRATPG